MLMTAALTLALLGTPAGPVPQLPGPAGAGAEPVGAGPVGAEPVGAGPVGAGPVGAGPVGAELPVLASRKRGDGARATVPLAHGARTPADRWWAPVTPTRVVARFDPPERPWLPGHRGVDLAAAAGDAVRAARAGRVTFAGVLAGRGVVAITHGELRTTYEPVAPSVARGEWVDGRALIGVVTTGTGHCGAGTCLHLGLRRGGTYLDPMLALRGGSPRLRPW